MRRRANLAKTLKGMHHKADGGPLGDIGSRNPGRGGIREQLAGDTEMAESGLLDTMHSGPGVNDRFFDSGTRIPGRMKAKNDAYRARLKSGD